MVNCHGNEKDSLPDAPSAVGCNCFSIIVFHAVIWPCWRDAGEISNAMRPTARNTSTIWCICKVTELTVVSRSIHQCDKNSNLAESLFGRISACSLDSPQAMKKVSGPVNSGN